MKLFIGFLFGLLFAAAFGGGFLYEHITSTVAEATPRQEPPRAEPPPVAPLAPSDAMLLERVQRAEARADAAERQAREVVESANARFANAVAVTETFKMRLTGALEHGRDLERQLAATREQMEQRVARAAEVSGNQKELAEHYPVLADAYRTRVKSVKALTQKVATLEAKLETRPAAVEPARRVSRPNVYVSTGSRAVQYRVVRPSDDEYPVCPPQPERHSRDRGLPIRCTTEGAVYRCMRSSMQPFLSDASKRFRFRPDRCLYRRFRRRRAANPRSVVCRTPAGQRDRRGFRA